MGHSLFKNCQNNFNPVFDFNVHEGIYGEGNYGEGDYGGDGNYGGGDGGDDGDDGNGNYSDQRSGAPDHGH